MARKEPLGIATSWRSWFMIIVRSPLRISLGGGGTDLPSYYEQYGGFLVAAAIDKYVYITLHHSFTAEFIVKYSRLERVKTVEEIQHPIVREALKLAGLQEAGLEITSMADIPAGTGLGSSGSFTTALLKALHTYRKNIVHPQALAEQACQIEKEMIDNLHFVKELGYQCQEALERGDLPKFGELMNVHWGHKKRRSGNM